MLKTTDRTESGAPGCWFGGEPTLPSEISWPLYSHSDVLEIPMHFLVQINLAYVPQVLGLPRLPTQGTLFVFYDPALAPAYCGFNGDEPSALITGRGAKVIFVDKDVSAVAPRPPPPMPDFFYDEDVQIAESYDGTVCYEKWPFNFLVYDTYPSANSAIPFACFDRLRTLEGERDRALGEHLFVNYSDIPIHSIFGASQIQNFPNQENLERKSRSKYPPLTDDNTMLFRFEADREIGHTTQESIALSFWILNDDLAARNFDLIRVWEDE